MFYIFETNGPLLLQYPVARAHTYNEVCQLCWGWEWGTVVVVAANRAQAWRRARRSFARGRRGPYCHAAPRALRRPKAP